MPVQTTFTREKILRATMTLARQRGIDRVLKEHIAKKLGCSEGTINTHWGSIKKLRDHVRSEARRRRDAQLLTGRIFSRQ